MAPITTRGIVMAHIISFLGRFLTARRVIVYSTCALLLGILLVIAFCNVSVTSYREQNTRRGLDPRHAMETDVTPKVVILSYMKSGTTLLGNLFNTSPEAFYVFEPLWYACNEAVPNYNDFIYLNGTKRSAPRSCSGIGENILDNYLNCDIGHLDIGTLSSAWHLQQGYKTGQFQDCGLTKPCIKQLANECKKSKLRVAKVIRFRLEDLKPLMKKYPELKILHLVRDPRGIIQSRIKAKEVYALNPLISARELCGDMSRDIETFKQIRVLFPNRIYQLRYEDFVDDLVKQSAEVYAFINVTMPEKSKIWLNKLLGRDEPKRTQSSPSEISYKWRHAISWDLVSQMNSVCRSTFSELLYSSVSTEAHLRNKSKSLLLEMCKNTDDVQVCEKK